MTNWKCSCCGTELGPIADDESRHRVLDTTVLCTPCFDAGCLPIAPDVEIPPELRHIDVRDCQRKH